MWKVPAVCAVCALATILALAAPSASQAPRVEEITIAQIQEALRAHTLTCRELVEQYLGRIEAYDKAGPAINAIITPNPDALNTADDLDRRFASSGPVGRLHCVPVIVKDNYETRDLPTSAGSLSLTDMRTGHDAFIVARLRAAGAVMIAKSNMAEFAFSQYETVGSALPGYTRNPYDINRVTAGSSGGSAAAVAANFGAVGLGTDTGASIRAPASHQALVGLRPTMGLTSRSGVVPVFLDSDVTGALTRTVADTAAVLDVIAGEDPEDAATKASRGHVAGSYVAALVTTALRGARLGVLHQVYDTPTSDAEVMKLFATALADMRAAGATLVDPVAVQGLDEMRERQRASGTCNTFKYELNRYLAGVGDRAPMHSLQDIVSSRRFHPSIQLRLETSQATDDIPGTTPGCQGRVAFRTEFRDAVLKMMDANHLDALVYPTWSNPPRLIGDLNTPHGDNNQLFAPNTGFPAISVPMGFTRGGRLPAGLQFFGRAWSEQTLIRLAYAYEQATHHRRPSPLTPPLAPPKKRRS